MREAVERIFLTRKTHPLGYQRAPAAYYVKHPFFFL